MVKNITRKNERNAQKHEARGLKKVFEYFCVVFACAHDGVRLSPMFKNITRKNERNAQKHEARGLKKVFARFCVVFACAHDSVRVK